ncbi:MAG: hypothetical protein WA021_01790 [Minisyncoccia bacterium]
MLVIKAGDRDRYPFSFGISKARLMVKYIDAIRAFVAKHDSAATGE